MTKPRDRNDYAQLGIEPEITLVPMSEPSGGSEDCGDCGTRWGPLRPFEDQGGVPPFPVEVLPGRWSEHIRALTEATQVPVDLPGMMLLGVWATAVQGKYRIRGWEGWYEPLCVWPCVALDPGNRKSAVLRALFEPVRRFEQEQRKGESPKRAEALAQRAALEAEISRLRKRTAKADATDAEREALTQQRDALERIVVPFEPPILLAADTTMEAVGVLLRDHGRITIASEEGGEVFQIAGGRYSEGHNYDILLKAHAGDSHVVHRIGREPLYIDRAIASVALAVQPEVLEQLGRDTTGMQGRGFLPRFLWSIPRSPLGVRRIRTEPVPEELSGWYGDAVRTLLSLPGQRDEEGAWIPRLIDLDPAAQQVLEGWAREVEPWLGPSGQLAAHSGWGSKLVGATLRMAGLLHAAERPAVDPSARRASAEAVANAVTLARYCIPHALAAFGCMGQRNETERHAVRVLQWAQTAGLSSFTERDVWQTLRRSFHDEVRGIRPALEELAARNYLREVPPGERKGPGRKPSPRWEVHPDAVSHNPQIPQNRLVAMGASREPA
jgi:hypothetical protein